MEFKGTKGKWEKVTANWDLDQCVFIEDTEKKICDIKSLSHNAIYDALLISKAPEMLEMLNRIVYNLENEECPFDEDEIKQLIKEATEL